MVQKRVKKFGQGSPPPLYGQCLKEKFFLSGGLPLPAAATVPRFPPRGPVNPLLLFGGRLPGRPPGGGRLPGGPLPGPLPGRLPEELLQKKKRNQEIYYGCGHGNYVFSYIWLLKGIVHYLFLV